MNKANVIEDCCHVFSTLDIWVDWVLDAFLHSVGSFCANGVGVMWLKGGLFGSKLLVGSLGWKKGGWIVLKQLGRKIL